MFTAEDILKHKSYDKSSEMVKEISDDMDGKTFHHHYHINYPLSEMLGEMYETFAEIGSYCGGSMCLMLQNKKGKNFISIDPFKAKSGQEKIFDSNTSHYISEDQKLQKFVGLSTTPKIIKESNAAIKRAGGADILFIDGSHAANVVKEDFKNFNESVNAGGFIVFDDYMDSKESPGVKKAVDEMNEGGSFDNYNVIGTIENKCGAFSNGGSSKTNNEYIIQKNVEDI
jgi:cephalosporin hydroxylase